MKVVALKHDDPCVFLEGGSGHVQTEPCPWLKGRIIQQNRVSCENSCLAEVA